LSTNLLEREVFIGDYIHATDKRQTLAITNQKVLDEVANSQLYRDCKRRVDLLKQSVGQQQPRGAGSQRQLGQSQKL